MNVRSLPLSAVTVSLHYLPRCLRLTVSSNKLFFFALLFPFFFVFFLIFIFFYINYFSPYCFHCVVVLWMCSCFRGLCAFVWFRHWHKCISRFVMRHLHVSLTCEAIQHAGRIEKPFFLMGLQNKKVWEVLA